MSYTKFIARQAPIIASKHQKSTCFFTILMLTFHPCLTQKGFCKRAQSTWWKTYAEVSVYSACLLNSVLTSKQNVSSLCINLICSGRTGTIQEKTLGDEGKYRDAVLSCSCLICKLMNIDFAVLDYCLQTAQILD